MKKILASLVVIVLGLAIVVPLAAAGPSAKQERRAAPTAVNSRVVTHSISRVATPTLITAPASFAHEWLPCGVRATSTAPINTVRAADSDQDVHIWDISDRHEALRRNVTIFGDVNALTISADRQARGLLRPASIPNECPGQATRLLSKAMSTTVATPTPTATQEAVPSFGPQYQPCGLALTTTSPVDRVYVTSSDGNNNSWNITTTTAADYYVIEIIGDVQGFGYVTGTTGRFVHRPADRPNQCPGTAATIGYETGTASLVGQPAPDPGPVPALGPQYQPCGLVLTTTSPVDRVYVTSSDGNNNSWNITTTATADYYVIEITGDVQGFGYVTGTTGRFVHRPLNGANGCEGSASEITYNAGTASPINN